MIHTDQSTVSLNAQQMRRWLADSDRVLIGAGAGLSAAAGLDYTDPETFARLFPALVRRGFRARYELIGYDNWKPAEKWGYWATHVDDARFRNGQRPVYAKLLDLVRSKDYFVLTSNVDALFARNGFDEQRIYTPQGDYAAMQCLKPCRKVVWPSQPVIERLLPVIDPITQVVYDARLLPHCPNCGSDVFLNVRGGDWFVEEPYADQAHRLRGWLREALTKRILIIEIGAGFNTPSVIRWPMEAIAVATASAKFVRINVEHAEISEKLADRSMSLKSDALSVINAVWQIP